MYFFKIEISSFDDAAKTLFVIPEQNADEKGVPFEEKMLTQTADFKQFVKATQTCMVDGKYTQYKTAEVLDSLDEKRFEQLKAEGRIEELDGNTFSISTGFSPKKGGKGKLDMKTILIIGGAAVVLIALLVFSSISGGDSGETPETSEISETVETAETAESTETPPTETTVSETTEPPVTSSSDSPDFVDEPVETTTEPTAEANEDGYTDGGYSGGSTSGESGLYTISFNLNGGEGSLESITEKAG